MQTSAWNKPITLAAVIVVSGCVTGSAPYKRVDITNPTTGVVSTCLEPLDTVRIVPTTQATLEATFTLKASTKKALSTFDSNGNIGGSLSIVTEQLRKVSDQSTEIVSLLFPYCVQNAQGKLSDLEYIRRSDALLEAVLKQHVTSHPYSGKYTGTFSVTKLQFGSVSPENSTGTGTIQIDTNGSLSGYVQSITLASPNKKQTVAIDGLISTQGRLSAAYILPDGLRYSLNGVIKHTASGVTGSISIDPGIGEVDVNLAPSP